MITTLFIINGIMSYLIAVFFAVLWKDIRGKPDEAALVALYSNVSAVYTVLSLGNWTTALLINVFPEWWK